MLQRSLLFLFPAVFVLVGIALPTPAADKQDSGRITKCQDTTGKWHYGDRTAVECSESKVEVLNKDGIKTKEIAAPPSAAELADRERRKDEIERGQKQAEDQTKRDQILLQNYAVEDDIILVRDRKLKELDGAINESENTLKVLRGALARLETQSQAEEAKNDKTAFAQTDKNIAQTKAQIERHEAAIAQKRQEQDKLRKQYADDLERYRELKRAPAAGTSKK